MTLRWTERAAADLMEIALGRLPVRIAGP
jgi:hypothetical protein